MKSRATIRRTSAVVMAQHESDRSDIVTIENRTRRRKERHPQKTTFFLAEGPDPPSPVSEEVADPALLR